MLARASFVPTLRPTFGYEESLISGVVPCVKYASAKLHTEGPFELQGPNGKVAVVAYAGIEICLWSCWKRETKVFSYVVADFETVKKTWRVWNITKEAVWVPGDSSMCPKDTNDTTKSPVTWSSPTTCSGKYCNKSSSNTYT